MTTIPDPRKLDVDNLGLPPWAWPLIGLAAGLALVVLIHATCFVDPKSE